jgi:hypothetical protein
VQVGGDFFCLGRTRVSFVAGLLSRQFCRKSRFWRHNSPVWGAAHAHVACALGVALARLLSRVALAAANVWLDSCEERLESRPGAGPRPAVAALHFELVIKKREPREPHSLAGKLLRLAIVHGCAARTASTMMPDC